MILNNSNGTVTHFKEAGGPSNDAVLLLHGLGAEHKMWVPQMDEFASQGFYVLAPDMLGHGASSRVEALELRDWEAQITGLLEAKGLDDCSLVGVSMGGVIAQSYAVHYPERVNRLVLADTFGELKTFREKVLGASQVLGFRLYKILGAKMLAKGMASAYKQPFARETRDYMYKVSLDADFDQLVLARQAINKIDAIGKIDGDAVPTLVLVGDQFGSMFVDINRKIAAGIRGSRFVVLSESMDPSNLVNPEAFNREVLAFFKGK